jgi:hypothetical protein
VRADREVAEQLEAVDHRPPDRAKDCIHRARVYPRPM